MHQSKLIQVLKIFKHTDLQQLQKFVASPFFNDNERLIQLLQLITIHAPTYTAQELSKPRVHAHIFQEGYNRGNAPKLRRLMSSLLKLVEQYIAHQQLKDNTTQMQLDVLQFYNKKRLHYPAKDVLKRLHKWQSNTTNTEEHYYTDFKIAQGYSDWQRLKDPRNQLVDFTIPMMALDSLHIVKKLQLACLVYNKSHSFKNEASVFMLTELLESLPNSAYFQIPAVSLYYYAVQLLLFPDKRAYFDLLQQRLLQYITQLPAIQLQQLFGITKNHCIRQINRGRLVFYEPLFELYKTDLAYEISVANGYFTAGNFKNMITVGLRMGAYDWVKYCLDTHITQVDPKLQTDVYNYNVANWHFYQQQFNEAIKYLHAVQYNDVFYQIDSRKLLLKIYYELREMVALEALMNSFRVMIHRFQQKKSIAEYHQQTNRHFINFLYKIIRLLPHQKDKVTAIIEQIHATNELSERQWLLAKLYLMKA